MVVAGRTNSLLMMVAEGIPLFSNAIPSCKLHELQEPQSPTATTAKSMPASLTKSSISCSDAGRVKSGF